MGTYSLLYLETKHDRHFKGYSWFQVRIKLMMNVALYQCRLANFDITHENDFEVDVCCPIRYYLTRWSQICLVFLGVRPAWSTLFEKHQIIIYMWYIAGSCDSIEVVNQCCCHSWEVTSSVNYKGDLMSCQKWFIVLV